MALERLDKCLVKLGIGSRTEVKKLINFGRVKVNENIIIKPEFKLDVEKDELKVDDIDIELKEFEYYVLNKPAGCICALEDKKHKTVMSYINDARKGLVPVGRLDIDTEGLLLITDDGKLNHRLLSPAHHVPKVYFAKVSGVLPKDSIELFEKGIELDDGITKPAKLEILDKEHELNLVKLTISEGRFHQVKRMFIALSCEVVYLRRISFASLSLDKIDLDLGEYRKLTKEEIAGLKVF